MIRRIYRNWQRRPTSLVLTATLVSLLLILLVALVVFLTGGTRYVYAHMAYVPIVVAGLAAGPWGGVIAGVAAGLALGPFMPLDVATGEMQEVQNWGLRLAFFVATGTLVGIGSQVLHRVARTDVSSGMPNRAALEAQLARRAAVSWADQPSALVMLRLNALRSVSSMLSQGQLQTLWQQIGQRLDQMLPIGGRPFAIYSDQIAILLPARRSGLDRSWAEELVTRMSRPFQVGDIPLHLDPCAGIARLRQGGSDGDLGPIMLATDCAQRAHRLGRPVEEEADEAQDSRRQTLRLLGELPEAMHNRQLDHHYQPKMVLADGRVSGLEALLRWHHTRDGLVPPGTFLPAVEQTGLIEPLTWYALDRACRQAAEWRQFGVCSLPVSVNLSARNLLQDDFVERAVGIVESAGQGLAPRDVELEVTESAVMQAPLEAIDTLRRLRAVGFRIAIDDFGTGYSSLGYLSRLPADTLKLDRGLIETVAENPRAASVVGMMVRLAEELGMRVVAEGLETPATARLLAGIGCHEVQGYLLARPMPAARLLDWLHNEAPRLAQAGSLYPA